VSKNEQWEEKCWGEVWHLFHSEHAAVSYLKLNAGFRCSRHYHAERANQFVVISGRIMVEWGTELECCTELGPDEAFTVPSKILHRFRVLESGVVIEVYWPDVPGGKVRQDDIVRFDEGGVNVTGCYPIDWEEDLVPIQIWREQQQQLQDRDKMHWKARRSLLSEIIKLQAIIDQIIKSADGVPIITEGPVYTPDGRLAYIEPFNSTPIAVIKHESDSDKDEFFEASKCYSTREAAEAAEQKEDPFIAAARCQAKHRAMKAAEAAGGK